jgi:DNA-binding NarL/FixJ family response regulator
MAAASKQPIRVMIVDDHEVVRLGLRSALELEEDIHVVAEAGSGPEACQKHDSLRADVVLLDVVMPDMDGVETCRELLSGAHPPRVIMLTSYSDEQAVTSSILAGASGYLLKNIGRHEIARAIRGAAAGEQLLDPAVTRKVTEQLVALASGKGPRQADALTDREREILVLVARGLTNKQIATELVISEKTARNHVSHILEKLQLERRSQAAAYAAEKGLLKDKKPS